MKNNRQIIYIVDDDISVRRAMTLLLQLHGFKVETFINAADFLVFKHFKMPSCLLLDIRMPGVSGLELQKQMAQRELTIPIIFITGHGDIPMSVQAIQGGAVDFLQKPVTEKKLLNAITKAILKNKIQNKHDVETLIIKNRVKTLSPRELEVFRFVAQGLLNKQIALKRGTVLQTIKVHRARVMQKLNAKTVTELIHFAQKAGITSSTT